MEDKILIKDENNKEKEMNILFTFENDGSNYVLCFEEKDPESIYPFKYDDDGNLFIVEDKNELDIINECLEQYDEVNNNEKN